MIKHIVCADLLNSTLYMTYNDRSVSFYSAVAYFAVSMI